jgi:hypothetical protein
MTTSGKPRDSREQVEAIDAKFEEIRKRLGFASPTALMNAVAERFQAEGLSRRDFQRQVYEEKRMNSTYQRCLGEFAGFDWESREWKHGTCAEFLECWGRLRGGSELVEDTQFVDAETKSTDVAMLALFAPSNAPAANPGSIHVSFTLNCPRLAGADFECGVQAGWLEFDLGKATTTHARDRKAFGEQGARFNNARLTVQDPNFHKPSWWVEAIDGKWIGMVADVPADFLLVDNLAHGHCVHARFRVCVSEIGVSFLLPDNGKAAKAKLKKRLTLLKIVGDNDGKATVAAISIKLKAKPQEDSSRDV